MWPKFDVNRRTVDLQSKTISLNFDHKLTALNQLLFVDLILLKLILIFDINYIYLISYPFHFSVNYCEVDFIKSATNFAEFIKLAASYWFNKSGKNLQLVL